MWANIVMSYIWQATDMESLKKFLISKKPHVVAIASENR